MKEMGFDPKAYGEHIAEILALDGAGERLMPLASRQCSSEEARGRLAGKNARDLFPQSRFPEAAMSGLFLYFSCSEEAHEIAQNVVTAEGSWWHGILHRQEPDAANAAYWFRRVGKHPVLDSLRRAEPRYPGTLEFIDMCEQARKLPGSPQDRIAREIQRTEWQLLFDWCARCA